MKQRPPMNADSRQERQNSKPGIPSGITPVLAARIVAIIHSIIFSNCGRAAVLRFTSR
jgi:hypothetical protein